MDNPFADADAEWSDEEVLIPKGRRKTPYVPRQQHMSSQRPSSSSRSRSPSPDPHYSPIIPPKSPSRPSGYNHEDLVQRFYQVSRERDALRKELQRHSMRPHGIPARASVVYKSEEKTLIEDLQALRQGIRNWSEDYFGGLYEARKRRPHTRSAAHLFSSLTNNYKAYLKHNNDRPLLIQSFIWSKLITRIFSNLNKGCGYIWAGRLGDRKLRPINDTLRKAVRNDEQAEDYHHWRAMTVNLLVPQVDGKWKPTFDATPILKWIRRFCSRLRRRLRPWATQSLRLGKDQLYTIVSAAVALDLKMKKQRADYRFVTFTGGKPDQFWGYGFFDSEMEDIDSEYEQRGKKVELSVAPALERSGNANGHIFDQSFILVKAEVTCRKLDQPEQAPKWRKKSSRGGFRNALTSWTR